MKAFNFYRIDCIRCKKQMLLVIGMMIFFGAIFSMGDNSPALTTGYLFFLSVAFSGQPFSIETQGECGFIDMLPGTKRQRIGGRFLYAITGVVIAAIIGTIIMFGYQARGIVLPAYMWHMEGALIGAVLFLLAIEITCLYAVGRGRSQQFITLIQVVPTLVLFFTAYGIGTYVSEHGGLNLGWVMNHATALTVMAVIVGIVSLAASYLIVNKISEARDYA